MKTMTVVNDLYSALETAADRTGQSVQDLVTEALEAWLRDVAMDDAERSKIETARAEANEQGGVEFEEFFDKLLNDRR